MDNKYKVSIIVPTYNDSEELKDCIESISTQTYPNLEIIIINDGSTDDTVLVCDKLSAIDNRIRVVNQNHYGIGVARNIGLSVATGDFIEFVDSDDWLTPNNVERLIEEQEKSHSDIVVCKQLTFIQNKNAVCYSGTKQFVKVNTVQEWFKQQFDNKNLLNYYWANSMGKLIKRDLFNHIVFPDASLSEDEYTMWKVYLSASKICFNCEPLYYVRQWNQSTTAKLDREKLLPLNPLKEEISVISMLGFEISIQFQAYLYRLRINTQYVAEKGDFHTYNNLKKETELFMKYKRIML